MRARLAAFGLRITDAWLPRGPRDPDFTRRARTGVALIWAAIAITALAMGTQAAGFGDLGGDPGRLLMAMNLGALTVMLSALGMLRAFATLHLSSNLVLAYFCMFYLLAVLNTGGASSPIEFVMMALPLGALVVLGRRAALLWLGVVLLVLGGVYALHASGHVFEVQGSRAQRDQFWLNCIVGLSLLTFATVWAFDRARARALDTLEEANRELAIARRNADRASTSQSAFLTTMSHEIRTPLMAVLGFADITLEESPDAALAPEDRLAVSTIAQSGRNLLRIVDDLLDISSIESGRIEIHPVRSNVEQLLAAVVELLGHQADVKGTRLAVERAPGVPEEFDTDVLRMQQVLVNLVGNAIKFSPGGSVELRVEPLARAGEAWIRFQVTDSGIGMTAEQLETLFRPFSQADVETARLYGGTGLGLSISAVLVQSMGGEITADSRPGQGSTFRIDLPLASPQPRTHAAPQPTAAVAASAPAGTLCCRVLVVDDTNDNRRLIKHFLVRAGAEVTTAESGEDALRQFEQARLAGALPDVIVMDIQMPGMDGLAARSALRENGCEAPIIALTAHAMGSERARCLAAGFNDYASKPIDRAALVEFVARNLRAAPVQPEASAPSVSTFGETQATGIRRYFDALVDWLTPPSERGVALARRRTRTLLGCSIGPALVLVIELWPMARVWPPEIARQMVPLVALSALLCACLPLVYRWTASISLAVNALAAYMTGLGVAMTYWNGGPGSPVIAWLVLIPMVVHAVAGARAAVLWLAIGLVADVGFCVARSSGVPMPDRIPAELLAFGSTMSNVNVAILMTVLAIVHEYARSEAMHTLASANRWLDEARCQAERASQTKAMFLANVSHELRTPLTAILGFADVLIERGRQTQGSVGLFGEAALDALQTIRRSGRRLLRLINDLLDLAKVEAGGLRIESLEVDLAELIQRAVEPLRSEAALKQLRFDVRLDSALPARISTDPLRLGQLVANLCDNAIKFTREGHVLVTAAPWRSGAETWLHIAVEDTGCGIPAEHLPALFSAFHQVDSSTQRERGGSGLGLALCQRLAQRMGGSIRVRSEAGTGSCFTLELPLRAVQSATRATASPASRARPAAAEQLRDMRLLLADDSIDNQRLITRVLGGAGACVDVVEDGQQAVERALTALREDRPYEVILMDVEMPRLDGLAATRALRDAGCTGPILALTAHSLADERERCLEAGCDDVATKPIDWPKLFEQLASRRGAKPT